MGCSNSCASSGSGRGEIPHKRCGWNFGARVRGFGARVRGFGARVRGFGARVRGFGARVRGVLLGTLSIIVSVMAPPPIFYLKLWGVGAYLEIIGGST